VRLPPLEDEPMSPRIALPSKGRLRQTLVPKPKTKSIIGTKWIFRNKLDEQGNVVRNKSRFVAQGYNQLDGIYFTKTFAPVARVASIRIMFVFVAPKSIKLFQMDVKSFF